MPTPCSRNWKPADRVRRPRVPHRRVPHRRVPHRLALTGLVTGLAFASLASEPPSDIPDHLRPDRSPLGPWRAELDRRAPVTFVVRYLGPNRQVRGPVCYSFAGYNEVCLATGTRWFTRATELRLPAPGGVPLEFLSGYVIRLRFPDVTDATAVVDVGDG